MKKCLIFLFASLIIASNTFATVKHVSGYNKRKPVLTKNERDYSDNSNNDSTEPHLRVQLEKDTGNTDDTYIAFEPTAKTQYVFNEDAPYLQGEGEVSMASISSDNRKLAINRLPLPKQQALIIRLFVKASSSGIYELNMTENEGIPPLYEVWLMDAYKKDSLDMRVNTTYAFNILKSDTNTFGANRFRLVIRENTAMMVHLLDFTAEKANGGAQINWRTENEQDYTNFSVERSTDNGLSFTVFSNIVSTNAGSYNFMDKAPGSKTDQYRLKITDLNGTVSYSDIITLVYGNPDVASVNNMRVFPNPSSSVINLSINTGNDTQPSGLPANATTVYSLANTPLSNNAASYSIKIINISGLVIKAATSSQSTWQDNVSDLLPGTYIIQVINNNDNQLVGKSTFIKM